MTDTAIIIQARVGSTRLTNKVLLPFFKGKSILELLISKLTDNFNIPIIVATTSNELDNVIEEIVKNYNIPVFRGSENNVLNRFIETAKSYQVENIIRICADNPFLSVEYLNKLISGWNEKYDYLSFKTIEGTPSIQTHFGFWAELFSLKTIIKIQDMNVDQIYKEHVTNYIYSHPNEFNIHFEPIPEWISNKKNIRLTLDTLEDFDIQKEIYYKLYSQNKNFDVNEIIAFIEKNPDYLKRMEKNIKQNQKN